MIRLLLMIACASQTHTTTGRQPREKYHFKVSRIPTTVIVVNPNPNHRHRGLVLVRVRMMRIISYHTCRVARNGVGHFTLQFRAHLPFHFDFGKAGFVIPWLCRAQLVLPEIEAVENVHVNYAPPFVSNPRILSCFSHKNFCSNHQRVRARYQVRTDSSHFLRQLHDLYGKEGCIRLHADPFPSWLRSADTSSFSPATDDILSRRGSPSAS